jgi:hypothetical protein
VNRSTVWRSLAQHLNGDLLKPLTSHLPVKPLYS